MANIEKRGGYTPRRAREQRAYRAVVVGGTAALVTIVGFILDAAGIIGATIPVIALIVALISVVIFRSTTRAR